MKNAVMISIGVLIGLILAGFGIFFIKQPTTDQITILPTETPVPLVVYISGDVKEPGVYRLLPGSRVVDLVKVAGGFLEGANYERLNLADILVDGEQIKISSDDGAVPTPMLTIGDNGLTTSLLSPDFEPINLNTATQQDLESLPGIGPTLAQRIIEFRDINGDFATVDDLSIVPGISSTLMDEVRDYLTVD